MSKGLMARSKRRLTPPNASQNRGAAAGHSLQSVWGPFFRKALRHLLLWWWDLFNYLERGRGKKEEGERGRGKKEEREWGRKKRVKKKKTPVMVRCKHINTYCTLCTYFMHPLREGLGKTNRLIIDRSLWIFIHIWKRENKMKEKVKI